MESLQLLMNGFATALQPTNLIFAIIGCALGTMVGVLPGIGPSATTAMLIPVTFFLDPTAAIIMLCAIYYGSMYGGTITSILMNVPGEATTAVTCLDGYPMAKQGRAGPALAMAAIGSFIGASFSVMALVLVALPMTAFALKFGPPEFFSLMFMGLSLVTALGGKSLNRALISAFLGLLMSTVGIDPEGGALRLTFGQLDLVNGIEIVPVCMGAFGLAEIFNNFERPAATIITTSMKSLIPTVKDLKDSFWPIVRGTLIGFFLGLIPGVGAIVPTFIAYVAEKRMSKTPEKFGTGMIEGVVAAETANNAYANAAMIPLFTLGIPGAVVIGILMGAFMMNGLIPGPYLFVEHADFVWAVIASFYIGNVILLIMNLPLIPLWVSIMKIPYSILFAVIISFCILGSYTLDNNTFQVGMMVFFGLMGYAFKKLDIPIPPLILTLILGPLMEKGLRQSLEISDGSFAIFFTRPISAACLALSMIFIVTSTFRVISKVKGETEV